MAIGIWLAVALPVWAAADTPRPPDQPARGPGGSAASYASVESRRVGEQPTGAWVFVPADPIDETDVASIDPPWPLVLFFHGFTAVDPVAYRAWIDHIVRRGSVVVYPDYQSLRLSDLAPAAYLTNALIGVRDAVRDLETGDDLPLVDRDRVVTVGHSAGGVLAVNYAAVASDLGLPVPDAIMPVEPGGCSGCGFGADRDFGMPLQDLRRIAPETLALVVVGEDDTVVGRTGGEVIWAGLDHLPNAGRDFVVVRGDDHGEPSLDADHFFPLTGSTFGEVDALDWYGSWRLFDALIACAFVGETCEVALGGGAEQQEMGEWSDGTPLTPLVVTDVPTTSSTRHIP